MRWFRKPIPVRDNRFDSCTLRNVRNFFEISTLLSRLKCIETINNLGDLKEKILLAVKRADAKSIRNDLVPLIANRDFVFNLSRNIKKILMREIAKL